MNKMLMVSFAVTVVSGMIAGCGGTDPDVFRSSDTGTGGSGSGGEDTGGSSSVSTSDSSSTSSSANTVVGSSSASTTTSSVSSGETCADKCGDRECGTVDECDCGTCPAPYTCGADPDLGAFACGCVPDDTCVENSCGEVPDGCGSTYNCGGCADDPYVTCGGNVVDVENSTIVSGTPNQCGSGCFYIGTGPRCSFEFPFIWQCPVNIEDMPSPAENCINSVEDDTVWCCENSP